MRLYTPHGKNRKQQKQRNKDTKSPQCRTTPLCLGWEGWKGNEKIKMWICSPEEQIFEGGRKEGRNKQANKSLGGRGVCQKIKINRDPKDLWSWEDEDQPHVHQADKILLQTVVKYASLLIRKRERLTLQPASGFPLMLP